jgi:hypothetical protein
MCLLINILHLALMCMKGPAAGQRPALQFMQAPAPITGIPPGLEYLSQISQLLVHQQVEIFECKGRYLLSSCRFRKSKFLLAPMAC